MDSNKESAIENALSIICLSAILFAIAMILTNLVMVSDLTTRGAVVMTISSAVVLGSSGAFVYGVSVLLSELSELKMLFWIFFLSTSFLGFYFIGKITEVQESNVLFFISALYCIGAICGQVAHTAARKRDAIPETAQTQTPESSSL